jgi:hypothetical protein
MFLTFLLNIKRYGQLSIIGILIALTLYLNTRTVYLKSQIVDYKLAITKAEVLYEEQVRINDVQEQAAKEANKKHLMEQVELNRAVVPENCEAALEWAIRYLQQGQKLN